MDLKDFNYDLPEYPQNKINQQAKATASCYFTGHIAGYYSYQNIPDKVHNILFCMFIR